MSETIPSVTIQPTVHPADSLFLRVAAGEARLGEDTYELSTAMSGQPIIRLPDGRWVTFGWETLCRAADAAGAAGR